LEAVFEDAADLDAGKSEDHLVDLKGIGLEVHQVGWLGGEGDDGSIGVDGAALDVGHLEVAVLVRNVDGCLLLAFLGEDLDALVVAVEVERIVGCFFAIEVDGGGAGGLGVGGHLEFIVGGLLELGAEEGWGGKPTKKQEGRERMKAFVGMNFPFPKGKWKCNSRKRG
jgi:hypothetical protein